jgi:hypothetical protein
MTEEFENDMKETSKENFYFYYLWEKEKSPNKSTFRADVFTKLENPPPEIDFSEKISFVDNLPLDEDEAPIFTKSSFTFVGKLEHEVRAEMKKLGYERMSYEGDIDVHYDSYSSDDDSDSCSDDGEQKDQKTDTSTSTDTPSAAKENKQSASQATSDDDANSQCSENSFNLGKPYKDEKTSNLVIDADIVCDEEDPFSEWMPFIDFSGEFDESMPMETSFTFPADKKDEVIKAMKEHGYTYNE